MKNPKRVLSMSLESLVNMAPFMVKNDAELTRYTKQSYTWHPEGMVWVHTKIVYNRLMMKSAGDVDLALAALYHDLGKTRTTTRRGWNLYWIFRLVC